MPKLVCSKCEIELVIAKSGVIVIEHAHFGPYKIWSADEWACPNCGVTIVAGFGNRPLAEHYEDKFDSVMANISGHSEMIRHDYENQGQREQARRDVQGIGGCGVSAGLNAPDAPLSTR